MRPETGLPPYPEKRLIVFAGVSKDKGRLEAMKNRKPEAIMASFMFVKPTRRGKPNLWLEELDTWPHYRYLDSGAFSFLNRGQGSRIAGTGKTTKQLESDKREGDAKKVVLLSDVQKHFDEYAAYLSTDLDDWDFVFDMDMDTLDLTREDGSIMPGIEFTEWARPRLRAIAGDRFIPVWHPLTDDPIGFPRFKALCDEYKYIAIGSDMDLKWRPFKYLCDYAHSKGVLVHGLGTSKVEILDLIPFDTADSSTWLSGSKFGMYAGRAYTTRARNKAFTPVDMKRMLMFEETVRALGYDPAKLSHPNPDVRVQCEVAIALMQERQNATKPVPPPLGHGELDFGGTIFASSDVQ